MIFVYIYEDIYAVNSPIVLRWRVIVRAWTVDTGSKVVGRKQEEPNKSGGVGNMHTSEWKKKKELISVGCVYKNKDHNFHCLNL